MEPFCWSVPDVSISGKWSIVKFMVQKLLFPEDKICSMEVAPELSKPQPHCIVDEFTSLPMPHLVLVYDQS